MYGHKSPFGPKRVSAVFKQFLTQCNLHFQLYFQYFWQLKYLPHCLWLSIVLEIAFSKTLPSGGFLIKTKIGKAYLGKTAKGHHFEVSDRDSKSKTANGQDIDASDLNRQHNSWPTTTTVWPHRDPVHPDRPGLVAPATTTTATTTTTTTTPTTPGWGKDWVHWTKIIWGNLLWIMEYIFFHSYNIPV